MPLRAAAVLELARADLDFATASTTVVGVAPRERPVARPQLRTPATRNGAQLPLGARKRPSHMPLERARRR